MYPITMSISYLIIAFCYFGAAEPPPAHGYGPPTPIHFDSNEVSSHEQYNAPSDFGNYAGFGSGSPSGYSHPSAAYTKSSSGFGGGAGHFGGAPSPYKGGKGGVSSSYISIVHGPGGGSPSKLRSHGAYTGAAANKAPAAVVGSFHGANFGAPSTFVDGKFGGSSAYTNEAPSFGGGGGAGGGGGGAAASSPFGKIFGGSGAGSSYNGGGASGGGFDYAGSDYNKGYEGGASDEVGSYSSGGPSYATFAGSKPSFSSPSFSQGSRGGNAYSTSNLNFGGGGGGGGKVIGGHGTFHPPSFTANFKPSGSKTYSRYHGPSPGGYVGGSGSAGNFGANPLVGSETGYNSRALKSGYTVDGAAEDFNSAEETNLFPGFGDGTGFKVQSSYSTG